ncbi:hypothetical protein EJB05_17747, partial [Eragrostis curvula]
MASQAETPWADPNRCSSAPADGGAAPVSACICIARSRSRTAKLRLAHNPTSLCPPTNRCSSAPADGGAAPDRIVTSSDSVVNPNPLSHEWNCTAEVELPRSRAVRRRTRCASSSSSREHPQMSMRLLGNGNVRFELNFDLKEMGWSVGAFIDGNCAFLQGAAKLEDSFGCFFFSAVQDFLLFAVDLQTKGWCLSIFLQFFF